MTESELITTLALQHVPYIGDIIAKKLIGHCGSPAEVFKEKRSKLLKINGVGSRNIADLWNPDHFRAAEKEMEFILKNRIGHSYFEEEEYPERLKHCVDGPILIFKKGHTDIRNKKVISVVGTRQVTAYGLSVCEKLIEELSVLDPVIVSGFAYGVDIIAHRAAVKNGLQTIGCLAHGLNQVYPKEHKKYRKQIEEKGGFITDFWSTAHPDKENFIKRNRIIAGLSEATIVIESAEKGGSLITADLANSYNREVFAVPGRTGDRYSRGCNDLIRSQKAHLLSSVADLIYILGWELEQKEVPAVQKKLFAELDPTEKIIYDFLLQNGKELLDIIALKCALPVHKVAASLLEMELKGVIRPLPGKLYEII
ncbi:DNA-protecting protein DprA [Leptobacterium flavescens]|uniref:DNA-protecting protein DprA n=1 Tax=Leptobacterium flavescens TaxID=472055 RepID=A0A6P0UKY2_9FLAO|nr:DNA-processing protein DprA [Leptobacterium flavescens]NER13202.1 DNA-protecting protein DprA [Leptobacterium flavescens]